MADVVTLPLVSVPRTDHVRVPALPTVTRQVRVFPEVVHENGEAALAQLTVQLLVPFFQIISALDTATLSVTVATTVTLLLRAAVAPSAGESRVTVGLVVSGGGAEVTCSVLVPEVVTLLLVSVPRTAQL